jgi:hypothetical protein
VTKSLTIYETIWRHIAEDSILHSHRFEDLRYRITSYVPFLFLLQDVSLSDWQGECILVLTRILMTPSLKYLLIYSIRVDRIVKPFSCNRTHPSRISHIVCTQHPRFLKRETLPVYPWGIRLMTLS